MSKEKRGVRVGGGGGLGGQEEEGVRVFSQTQTQAERRILNTSEGHLCLGEGDCKSSYSLVVYGLRFS